MIKAISRIAAGIVVSAGLASAALAQDSGPAADSVSIRAVVADLDSAWVHGDADRWAAHYVPDAEFINIRGTLLPNALAVRARHHEIFTHVFKGTRQTGTLRRVRFLAPDIAIADVNIEVTGFSTLPPGTLPTEEGVLRTRMRHVLKRIDGQWWIVATQNTAVAPSQ